MPTAKERLFHLLALAAEGPAQRAVLAGELADLVLDWPSDCPEAMRTPVITLFALTVRETDEETRSKLAARIGGHDELPLHLINEFFICAPARLRREILTRNALTEEEDAVDGAVPQTLDIAALIDIARNTSVADFTVTAARALGIAPNTLRTILADGSAEMLSVLCKGVHLDRAAFSALALLQGGGEGDAVTRLMAYDTVPQRAAEKLTRHWRARAAHISAPRAHAAE